MVYSKETLARLDTLKKKIQPFIGSQLARGYPELRALTPEIKARSIDLTPQQKLELSKDFARRKELRPYYLPGESPAEKISMGIAETVATQGILGPGVGVLTKAMTSPAALSRVSPFLPIYAQLYPKTFRVAQGVIRAGLAGAGVGAVRSGIEQIKKEDKSLFKWAKETGWTALKWAPWGVVPASEIGLGRMGNLKRVLAAGGIVGTGSAGVDLLRKHKLTPEDTIGVLTDSVSAMILQGVGSKDIARYNRDTRLQGFMFERLKQSIRKRMGTEPIIGPRTLTAPPETEQDIENMAHLINKGFANWPNSAKSAYVRVIERGDLEFSVKGKKYTIPGGIAGPRGGFAGIGGSTKVGDIRVPNQILENVKIMGPEGISTVLAGTKLTEDLLRQAYKIRFNEDLPIPEVEVENPYGPITTKNFSKRRFRSEIKSAQKVNDVPKLTQLQEALEEWRGELQDNPKRVEDIAELSDMFYPEEAVKLPVVAPTAKGGEIDRDMADLQKLIPKVSEGKLGYAGEALGLGKIGDASLDYKTRSALKEIDGILEIRPELASQVPDHIIKLANINAGKVSATEKEINDLLATKLSPKEGEVVSEAKPIEQQIFEQAKAQIAPKTPQIQAELPLRGEITAPKPPLPAPKERVSTGRLTLYRAIKDAGKIKWDPKSDIRGELEEVRRKYPGLFSKKGISIDEIASNLQEEQGWPISNYAIGGEGQPVDLWEALVQMLNRGMGRVTLSELRGEKTERQMRQEMKLQAEEEAEAAGYESVEEQDKVLKLQEKQKQQEFVASLPPKLKAGVVILRRGGLKEQEKVIFQFNDWLENPDVPMKYKHNIERLLKAYFKTRQRQFDKIADEVKKTDEDDTPLITEEETAEIEEVLKETMKGLTFSEKITELKKTSVDLMKRAIYSAQLIHNFTYRNVPQIVEGIIDAEVKSIRLLEELNEALSFARRADNPEKIAEMANLADRDKSYNAFAELKNALEKGEITKRDYQAYEGFYHAYKIYYEYLVSKILNSRMGVKIKSDGKRYRVTYTNATNEVVMTDWKARGEVEKLQERTRDLVVVDEKEKFFIKKLNLETGKYDSTTEYLTDVDEAAKYAGEENKSLLDELLPYKEGNYIPHVRDGNWWVQIYITDEKIGAYLVPNQTIANKFIENVKKTEWYKKNQETIRIEDSQHEDRFMIHPSFGSMLDVHFFLAQKGIDINSEEAQKIIEAYRSLSPIYSHLIHTKDLIGYKTDWNSIVGGMENMARAAINSQRVDDLKETQLLVKDIKNGYVSKVAGDYLGDLMITQIPGTLNSIMQAAKGLMYFTLLANKGTYIAQNLTEWMWSLLRGIEDVPVSEWKSFFKSFSEEYELLLVRATKEGLIKPFFVEEYARGLMGKLDILGKKSERFSSAIGFKLGLQLARHNNLKGDEAYRYAYQFLLNTAKPFYHPANKLVATRGREWAILRKHAFLLFNWMMDWMDKFIYTSKLKTKIRKLILWALLAGVGSLPFGYKLLRKLGLPKNYRNWTFIDRLLVGGLPMATLGVATQFLAPVYARGGSLGAAGTEVTSWTKAWAVLFDQVKRAGVMWERYGVLGAMSTLPLGGLQYPLKGLVQQKGVIIKRGKKLRKIYTPRTTREKGLMLLGFTPYELSEEYRRLYQPEKPTRNRAFFQQPSVSIPVLPNDERLQRLKGRLTNEDRLQRLKEKLNK